MGRFTYQGRQFYLDGRAFSLRSGAMHYFRIPRAYWRDRLLKLKECGFNCVETYIPWNYHEEKEGTFDFSGDKDFGAFLDIAKELGLLAIVRPGPYVCAEWNGGGLPSWLFLRTKGAIRCNDSVYVEKLTRYLQKTFAFLLPRIIDNGGNVIMLQVENEYGAYGNDGEYLRRLTEIYRENGVNCLLFTADNPYPFVAKAGGAEGCLPFFNFGSGVEEKMRIYDELQINTPRVCAEFWAGWFDSWGGEHHVRTEAEMVAEIEPFLKSGYGFNIYMFHGGTNFGFWNGSNYSETEGILPTVTSYDYCAPLNEAGDRTPVYYALRALMEKYGVDVPPLTATDSEKRAYACAQMDGVASLFPNLEKIGKVFKSSRPMTMEDCGQEKGYVAYTTRLSAYLQGKELTLQGVGDRALVFLDGERIGEYYPKKREEKIILDFKGKDSATLTVLVENEGRVNYGPHIPDCKGITGGRADCQNLFDWTNISLPMDDLSALAFLPITEGTLTEAKGVPAFFRGSITVDAPADTFLRVEGARKGFVVVNGFLLGRYNEIGPQKTLYLPKPVLREGQNEVLVFDVEGKGKPTVSFLVKPILG